MNLQEKKNLVIHLHQEEKTQREIAKTAHISVRDISKIILKFKGIQSKRNQ
jgi:DNA-directed RNA polymerase specialized sigma subunit